MRNFQIEIMKSWISREGNVNTNDDILSWIKILNEKTKVCVTECNINDSDFWFYDDYNGEILNRKRSFFSIIGMRHFEDGIFIGEQPIIIQPEIGYLGIICKKIDGILNFLMQAKIEPGNINCVQISPTIQATKSNFTRAHGGKLPAYFEYFENSKKYDVIYDQVQSEQASRFYKKRNRNMIMYLDEDIEVLSNFKWMTLGQIKELMKIDNLINMDTRTVLSGIPFGIDASMSQTLINDIAFFFDDQTLFESIYYPKLQEEIPNVFQKLNNYKMFKDIIVTTVPLNQLVDWRIDDYGISCEKLADFCVRYYDINISGREVQHWIQPLFKAVGSAVFALFSTIIEGVKKYLVRIKAEIGSFDCIEIGPSIQWESTHSPKDDNEIDSLFRQCISEKKYIRLDVILSEEGGRFFHEQNRNVIIDISSDVIKSLPPSYLWVDYGTLNYLVRMNNCLNIQLRNLLSLIDL